MGKWTALKGQYPKAPVDGSFLEKIEAVLNAPAPIEVASYLEVSKGFTIRDLNDSQIVALYKSKDKFKEQLAEQIKVLNLEIAAYTHILTERFDDEGEQTKVFEDGTRVTITPQPEPYVTDGTALRNWVVKEEMEELLTLSASSMKKLAKEALENGKPLPPGTDVYLRDQLTLTKPKS